MIRSFRCPDTERLAQSFERVARRKLRQLEIAGRLDDLRVPPGNRLEALRGDRTGQHSIRINDQFRLCFIWTAAGPDAVEIVVYHWSLPWTVCPPISPGELLQEEFLQPLGVSQYRLAKASRYWPRGSAKS